MSRRGAGLELWDAMVYASVSCLVFHAYDMQRGGMGKFCGQHLNVHAHTNKNEKNYRDCHKK